MPLRKYAVETPNPKKPVRRFWTYEGALNFGRAQDGDYRNVFIWRKGRFRLLDVFMGGGS